MALVETEDEFKRNVAKELKAMGMLAEAVSGLDLLENKIEGTEPTAELFNVVEDLREQGGVRFDEFETF